MADVKLNRSTATNVNVLSGKGTLVLYRTLTGTDADTTSDLSTPNSILSTTNPINTSEVNTIYLRARFDSSSGSITLKIVIWDLATGSLGGQPLSDTVTLTAGSEQDGDGKYISNLENVDVYYGNRVQCFVTAASNVDATNKAYLDVA